jgi:hypothetical protein
MEAKFNKLYDKQGFFDRYNGSVFITLLIMIVFFLIFAYSYIQRHITTIKANWVAERCTPMVIPFAGMVNAPEGTSKFKFTYKNFNFCINTIIKEVATYAMMPLELAVDGIHKILKEFTEAINAIRKILSYIRNAVSKVTHNIMSRILNLLIPIQKLLIAFKATMGKAHATMVTGMYSAIGGLWFTISGLLNVYNFIIVMLISLAATIAILWFIPFGLGAPAAIISTLTFMAVSIPLGIIAVAVKNIINVSGVKQTMGPIPTTSCFKKDTLIRGTNNILHSIQSIKLGTQLAKGGYVTAVLKLDASQEKMFNLGNIVVSGSHKVRYEKKWVYVCDHPDAIPIKGFEDKFIYCLNTSKKIIGIGDYVFQDWDEIDKSNIHKYGCDKESDIFDNLENGFHPDTPMYISHKDGPIALKDISIGDRLMSGEKIIGIVKIKNDKPLYEYPGFLATYQCSIIQYLGITMKQSLEQTDILYHLLTDSGSLHINEQKLKDYNWNIDYLNV